MTNYDYLIVGGGMAAAAAVKGIRERDPAGRIGLLCGEKRPPYARPPLSKGLWKGKDLDSIWMDSLDGELRLGHTVASLDAAGHQVLCQDGEAFGYGRLLLATGGSPRLLPSGQGPVIYFRSLEDYEALRGSCGRGRRFLVIGGGFIGSELAAALAMSGKEVVMAFPGEGIGRRTFPRELSLFLNDFYRSKGIEVLAGEEIESVKAAGAGIVARGASGREIVADGAVAGLGLRPNADLAEAAGLKVEDGIVVDGGLRTSEPDIFAAGDVASFHCEALGRRLRAEHEDAALAMGLMAGHNMAGASERYSRLPYFYSDLFELGYEAVGELDPGLETFADWKEPFRKGVVYYHREGRIRGILLWNVWKKAVVARTLVADGVRRSPGEFAGLI